MLVQSKTKNNPYSFFITFHLQNIYDDPLATAFSKGVFVKDLVLLYTDTCNFAIQLVGDAVVGKEMAAKLTFKNPLPQVLKKVKFRIEGLGLQKVREISYG